MLVLHQMMVPIQMLEESQRQEQTQNHLLKVS